MSDPEFVLRSQRVVTPDGIAPADVHVRAGLIHAIDPVGTAESGVEIVDCGEHALMPGLVDTHVHINEPGRTEWEGFRTATRAAAAGGVTTVIDMPLNSIPATISARALNMKMEAAEGRLWADVGFLGGVVPGNLADLTGLFEAGVFGFKCFLAKSGVPEFEHLSEFELRRSLQLITEFGSVLMVHAEFQEVIDRAAAAISGRDPRSYDTYLRSRPPSAEEEAVSSLVSLSSTHKARVHIVHLSSEMAVDSFAIMRHERISAETCPHYLHFTSGEVPDGATQFKCAPPIREEHDREALWRALGEGVIDCVVSDHSPCPPDMKGLEKGDFFEAWGGIPSLQLGLSVIWSNASVRGYTLGNLAEWMSAAPARLIGLDGQKGAIKVGHHADLAVFGPEEEFTVTPEMMEHRHKLTPYAGTRLSGVVHATYLRGRKVYDRLRFLPEAVGTILKR